MTTMSESPRSEVYDFGAFARTVSASFQVYIIDVKLADEALAKKRAENKIEKEKLLAILAEKQDGKLSALSEAELKKRIAALGD
jgi:hypothetical protein